MDTSQPAADLSPIVAKWGPSLVEVICSFKVPNITRSGVGILYADTTKTRGNLLMNSNVPVIYYNGGLLSFYECGITLRDGQIYEVPYDNKNIGMMNGSTERDGLFWFSIPFLAGGRRSIVATADDLCVHRPLSGEQVVLLDIADGKIVTSKTTIAGEVDGRHFWLGPKAPARSHMSAAIDVKRNCYLGIPSMDQSFFMTLFGLPLAIEPASQSSP